MSSPPFTVRAVYPYESDVDGDLNFDANQLISVEVIEDSEWYTGSYTDPKTKQLKSGMFPINFVETIAEEAEPEDEPEPEIVSPPVLAPAPVPVPVPAPVPVFAPAPVPAPAAAQPEPKQAKPAPPPEVKSSPIAQPPTPNYTPTLQQEPSPAPKKRNAFQDRIAAFNSSDSAPTPFSQPKPTSFVKKPFYAAPTNSYVPQIPHIPKPAKPTPPQVPVGEIVHYNDDASEDEKPVPKVSLKDRIRLLQEQQQAEAARAEALAAKKKQKKAAKKPEHDDTVPEGEEPATSSLLAEDDDGEQGSLEPTVTGGSLARTLSVGSAASREEFVHPDAQAKHHTEIQSVPEQPEPKEIETNEDDDEDSEEYEEDEEEARKQALRERMAKISGGMGMHLGMIMPGGFGAPTSSKKPKKKKVEEESEPTAFSQAPVPIFPFANPASMPEVLQHPPRAETEQEKVSEKEDLSDESESDVEAESQSSAKGTISNKPESNYPSTTTAHLRSGSITEPDQPLLPAAPIAKVPAPSLNSGVVPAESERAVSTFEPSSPAQPSRLPPPPVPQETHVQVPTSHVPSLPDTGKTSVSPVSVAPPSISPTTAPSAPAPERKLDSVIANHKEDSDTEESDSAWSDTEPSRAAPRHIPPVLAPPPPPPHSSTTHSVPPPPVSSKEIDVSEDEILDAYNYEDSESNSHVKPALDLKQGLSTQVNDEDLGDDERTESEDNRGGHRTLDPAVTSKRLSYLSGSGTIPPIPMSPQRVPNRENDSPSFAPIPATPTTAPPPPPPPSAPAPVHSPERSPRGPPPPPPTLTTPSGSNPQPRSPELHHRAPPPPPTAESIPSVPLELPTVKEPSISMPTENIISPVTSPVEQQLPEFSSPTSTEKKRTSIFRSLSQRAPPPPPPGSETQIASPSFKPKRASTDLSRRTAEIGRGSLDLSNQARRSLDVSKRSSEIYGHNRQASIDSSNLGNFQETPTRLATAFNLEDGTEWWFTEARVPKAVTERKDIVYEIDESQHIQRGGKVFCVRDIYVLFEDYSQTIITVEFSNQGDHVAFQQRFENPPAAQRQDQLTSASQTFGTRIALKVQEYVGQSLSRGELLPLLFKGLNGVAPVIPNHSYGVLLYKNISNTNVRQYAEILPGDIAVISNAFFQGHKGSLHQKYTQEVAGVIVGVVNEYDGTKRKIKVYDQTPKEDHGLYKVKSENYRLGDLKNGEVKVFRVVGREILSWN